MVRRYPMTIIRESDLRCALADEFEGMSHEAVSAEVDAILDALADPFSVLDSYDYAGMGDF